MKKGFLKITRLFAFALTAALTFPLFVLNGQAAGRVNLALHKSYKIKADVDNEYSSQKCERGKKDMLTDGVFGDTKDYYGGKWAHFVRAYGRSITVDLGSVCAVEEVCAYFIQHKDHGVYCPREVEFFLSEDGEMFQSVGKTIQPVKNTENGYIRVKYENKTQKYKARYVKIHFDVQVNLFIDEIEVFGTQDGTSAKKLNAKLPDTEDKELYFDNREALGVRDIICFHNGYNPDNPDVVNNKREIFKPYVGYVDSTGKYIDTMFDAVMFLTSMGRAPSGGSMIKPGGPTTLEDWKYLSDNTFKEDINVCALNAEVGEMKKQLNLADDYKVAVYLTVPYPKISDIVFGDIDGDGKADKIKTPQDCFDAYMLFVRETKKRFDSFGFENVKLKGFFWLSEAVDTWDNDYERDLAYKCVEAVHKENLQMVFIPSWQAPGVDYAHDVGFDAVIMQPNLSFNEFAQEDPERFMDEFVQNALTYHTGIQLEMADGIEQAGEKYAEYFEHYLRTAVSSGMMKGALHAYYQGAGRDSSFYQCATSSNPSLRRLYDCIYKFIKGKLSFSENPTAVGDAEITVQLTKRVQGKLTFSDDSFNNFKIVKQPPLGTVYYHPNIGKYSYVAGRKKTGTDTIEFIGTRWDGTEEKFTVTVNVIEKQNSAPPESSAPVEQSAESEKNNSSALKIALISSVAIIVSGGAAAFIIRKKKKK